MGDAGLAQAFAWRNRMRYCSDDEASDSARICNSCKCWRNADRRAFAVTCSARKALMASCCSS